MTEKILSEQLAYTVAFDTLVNGTPDYPLDSPTPAVVIRVASGVVVELGITPTCDLNNLFRLHKALGDEIKRRFVKEFGSSIEFHAKMDNI